MATDLERLSEDYERAESAFIDAVRADVGRGFAVQRGGV
jgi:hypothetical protein